MANIEDYNKRTVRSVLNVCFRREGGVYSGWQFTLPRSSVVEVPSPQVSYGWYLWIRIRQGLVSSGVFSLTTGAVNVSPNQADRVCDV